MACVGMKTLLTCNYLPSGWPLKVGSYDNLLTYRREFPTLADMRPDFMGAAF